MKTTNCRSVRHKRLLIFLTCFCMLKWTIANVQADDDQSRQQPTYKWQKYDHRGLPVDIKLGPWSCARDNETGLIWEIKSWHENSHYYKATYSWFDPQTRQGVKDGGSCQKGYEWYPCDVSDLLAEVNQHSYCGRRGWRLPTLQELKTLIYRKNIKGTLFINPYLFPATTRTAYLTADITEHNGRINITLMDFLRLKVQQRDTVVVGNVRLVTQQEHIDE